MPGISEKDINGPVFVPDPDNPAQYVLGILISLEPGMRALVDVDGSEIDYGRSQVRRPCWNCGGSGIRCCEYAAANDIN
jgi:hypothetical protein